MRVAKEGFINNINNGESLPDSFLTAIYDRIGTNRFASAFFALFYCTRLFSTCRRRGEFIRTKFLYSCPFLVADEISLKEDDLQREKKKLKEVDGLQDRLLGGADRRRREAYLKERESIVRQSEQMIKSKRKARGQSILHLPNGETLGEDASAPSSGEVGEEHIRPMFEISWAAMLAVFSMLLERR